MIKDADGFITKEAIINSMCLSNDHRYFMDTQEDARHKYGEEGNPIAMLTCMTRKEKEFLHKEMTHLYEGDIEPFMKIKKKYRK